MGLLDKVKNFFYDEEDVEDEYEEETHKEVIKENNRKYDPGKEEIVRIESCYMENLRDPMEDTGSKTKM